MFISPFRHMPTSIHILIPVTVALWCHLIETFGNHCGWDWTNHSSKPLCQPFPGANGSLGNTCRICSIHWTLFQTRPVFCTSLIFPGCFRFWSRVSCTCTLQPICQRRTFFEQPQWLMGVVKGSFLDLLCFWGLASICQAMTQCLGACRPCVKNQSRGSRAHFTGNEKKSRPHTIYIHLPSSTQILIRFEFFQPYPHHKVFFRGLFVDRSSDLWKYNGGNQHPPSIGSRDFRASRGPSNGARGHEEIAQRIRRPSGKLTVCDWTWPFVV